MPTPYEEALAAAGLNVSEARGGLATPSVGGVLGRSESPGPFEQFFRFLGRPAFVVRSAITGDAEGAARNALQFLNEMFFAGMGAVNQNWTLTSALSLLPGVDLPKDLTEEAHRPEFSDVLKRWGISDPRYMGGVEKFAVDMVGGVLTDPLSLVGGPAKNVASGSVRSAANRGRNFLGRTMYHGIMTGGPDVLKQEMRQHVNQILREIAEDAPAARMSRGQSRRFDEEIETFRAEAEIPDIIPLFRGDRDIPLHGGRSARPHPRDAERYRRFVRDLRAADEARIAQRQADYMADAMDQVYRQAEAEGRALGLQGEDLAAHIVAQVNMLVGPIPEVPFAPPPEPLTRLRVLRPPTQQEILEQSAAIAADIGPRRAGSIRQTIQNVLRSGEVNADNLEDLIRRAPEFGRKPEAVATFVRGVQNRAALRLTLNHAAREGTDLSSAVRTFVPNQDVVRHGDEAELMAEYSREAAEFLLGRKPLFSMSVLFGPPPEVTEALRMGKIMMREIDGTSGGRELLFYHPRNEHWANLLQQKIADFRAAPVVPGDATARNTLAHLVKDIGILYGYSDDSIREFLLRRELPDVVSAGETWHRILDELPSKVLDDGLEALYKRGLPRPGGLSYFSIVKGKWEHINWSSIYKLTLPGMIPPLLRAYAGTGAPGAPFARAMDAAIQGRMQEITKAINGWLQNRLVDHAAATEGVDPRIEAHGHKAAFRVDAARVKHFDRTVETWGSFNAIERANMTRALIQAGERFHQILRNGSDIDLVGQTVNDGTPLQIVAREADGRYRVRFPNGIEQPMDADYVQRLWEDNIPEQVMILGVPHRVVRHGPDQFEPVLPGEFAEGIAVTRDQLAGMLDDAFPLPPRRQGGTFTALRTLADLPETGVPVLDRARSLARSRNLDELRADPEMAEVLQRIERNLIAGQVMNDLRNELRAMFPGREVDVDKVFTTWQQGMEAMPPYLRFTAKYERDLRRLRTNARALWEHATGDPFYVPWQMSDRLRNMLDEGLHDPHRRSRITSVFEQARTYPTHEAFIQRLQGLADEFGFAWEEMGDLQNLDMADLYFRRMMAHEVTMARQELWQAAARLRRRTGGRESDYKFYINRVLHPLAKLSHTTGEIVHGGTARENPISKILGGGFFRVKVRDEATAQRLAREYADFQGRAVRDGDTWYLESRFEGIHYLWKPMLTSISPNVKFRFRNIFSAPIMLSFVEGMGETWKHVLSAIRNDPFVRILTRDGGNLPREQGGLKRALTGPQAPYSEAEMKRRANKGDLVTVWVRHLTGDTVAERMAALEVLKSRNAHVGPYTAQEVSDAIKMVAGGGPITQADLGAARDLLPELWDSAAALNQGTRNDIPAINRARLAWRKFVQWGEILSNEAEARFRIVGMLNLLQQGIDPVEAARRVNAAMVNYSKNSYIERAIRDVFPFARFMIASTQWARPMLERPGIGSKTLVNLQTLGQAQRSMITGNPGQEFLPSEAQGSIALPLPWRDAEGNYQFITSLGVPHEATIQIIGAVPSTDALRRNVLGAMSPPLRGIAEGVTGKSFYWGTDFGSYRKAPWFVPGAFAQKIPGPEGSDPRYEISGYANEIFNMLPTAGVDSTIERLVDGRRAWWNKLLVTTTGFRINSVDLDRELKRRVAKYLEDKVASGQIGEVQAFFTRMEPEDVPEDLRIMLEALAQERAAARKARKKKEPM